MADDALLRDTAHDLYATPLPEFIAARNERVRTLRKDGHGSVADVVAALKKPSAGADAVNRLIRDDGQLADDIAELGERLRAAQADPVAKELRALDQERRALVVRARSAARELDGALTGATLDHVEQTVWAALVDAQAAAVVLAGVLIRPLSPGGFGEVDTTGASAVRVEAPGEAPRRPRRTSPGKARPPEKDDRAEAARAKEEARRARKEAEAALAEAQDANGRAQDELAAATRSAEEAVQRRDDLEEERDDLRARLTAVEQSLRDAKAEVTGTTSALRDAERKRRAAAADVDRAVDRLR
ncbi:MAG: hypothetical protein ABWX74_14925 [Aeromicrobium sp.]